MIEELVGFDMKKKLTAGPRSVDVEIWPSLLVDDLANYSFEHSWVQHLLADLDEAESLQEAFHDSVELVAVCMIVPEEFRGYHRISSESSVRFKAEKEMGLWSRLGYDVADQFLTSAQSNTLNSLQIIAAKHGLQSSTLLFKSYKDSLAFRFYAENMVPEHAPWYIYSIWNKGESLSPVY